MADEVVTTAPTYESRMAQFTESWNKSMTYIRALLPQHVTPERIFSIAVTARQRNPKLLECTDISVLRGIIIGAQLGLDVSGVGGKGYLVPFWNKNTKRLEAQFMPGWRGLIELARRSGQIAAIYAREVYEGEEFQYTDGMQQVLHHVPSIGMGDPGKIIGAWAVAVWTNGFRQIEVMNSWQLEQVRKSSRAADDGPWVGWYAEMAKKTVIKRLMKKLPDSVEINRALDIEDHVDIGEPPIVDVDLPEIEPAKPEPTRTQSIVADIVKKRGPGRPPKPREPELSAESSINAELQKRGIPVAATVETDDMEADFADDDEETEDDE